MTDQDAQILCDEFRAALNEQGRSFDAAKYFDELRGRLTPEEFASIRRRMLAIWTAWCGTAMLKIDPEI